MSVVSQRKLIRQKVAAMLTTPPLVIAPMAAVTVYQDRQQRIAEEEKAVIIVYAKNESSEIWVAAPREYERILKLVVHIQIYKHLSILVEDKLDEIAAEVEDRIFQNDTLDGLAKDTILSDTEIDFVDDSEVLVGVCRITFDVKYGTEAPLEQANVDDFLRYHAEIQQPQATPVTVPMKDDTELEQ